MTDENLRLYRCYPRISGARKGKPGHWSYLPSPQLHGRWDNSDLYDSWYFSQSAVGAIAESFYNKRQWIPEVFLTPAGTPRAIAEFTFTGGSLLDLDDAEMLIRLGIKPSEVVVQDLNKTQQMAQRMFETKAEDCQGISWWSAQMPSETSVVLWGEDGLPPAGLKLQGIQSLSLEHPAVIEAAARLYRPLGA